MKKIVMLMMAVFALNTYANGTGEIGSADADRVEYMRSRAVRAPEDYNRLINLENVDCIVSGLEKISVESRGEYCPTAQLNPVWGKQGGAAAFCIDGVRLKMKSGKFEEVFLIGPDVIEKGGVLGQIGFLITDGNLDKGAVRAKMKKATQKANEKLDLFIDTVNQINTAYKIPRCN